MRASGACRYLFVTELTSLVDSQVILGKEMVRSCSGCGYDIQEVVLENYLVAGGGRLDYGQTPLCSRTMLSRC